MPEFYQDLITEKSLNILQNFKRKFDFILIGGWAVFLYTKDLKSKDIDLIVQYETLELLRKKYSLIKNERLRKYQIKQEGIDIDVYLPHYSDLGLSVEEVSQYVTSREGFIVPKIEMLLILKQFVFSHRQGSAKGEKDRLDILSLIKLEQIDWSFYQELLKKYGLEQFKEKLINLIKEARQAPELGLSEYLVAKLRNNVLKLISEKENN